MRPRDLLKAVIERTRRPGSSRSVPIQRSEEAAATELVLQGLAVWTRDGRLEPTMWALTGDVPK